MRLIFSLNMQMFLHFWTFQYKLKWTGYPLFRFFGDFQICVHTNRAPQVPGTSSTGHRALGTGHWAPGTLIFELFTLFNFGKKWFLHISLFNLIAQYAWLNNGKNNPKTPQKWAKVVRKKSRIPAWKKSNRTPRGLFDLE